MIRLFLSPARAASPLREQNNHANANGQRDPEHGMRRGTPPTHGPATREQQPRVRSLPGLSHARPRACERQGSSAGPAREYSCATRAKVNDGCSKEADRESEEDVETDNAKGAASENDGSRVFGMPSTNRLEPAPDAKKRHEMPTPSLPMESAINDHYGKVWLVRSVVVAFMTFCFTSMIAGAGVFFVGASGANVEVQVELLDDGLSVGRDLYLDDDGDVVAFGEGFVEDERFTVFSEAHAGRIGTVSSDDADGLFCHGDGFALVIDRRDFDSAIFRDKEFQVRIHSGEDTSAVGASDFFGMVVVFVVVLGVNRDGKEQERCWQDVGEDVFCFHFFGLSVFWVVGLDCLIGNVTVKTERLLGSFASEKVKKSWRDHETQNG